MGENKADSTKLLKKILNKIQNTFAPTEDGVEPTTLFSLRFPGLSYNKDMSEEQFSTLVDDIPQQSRFWIPSGRKVSLEMRMVAGAQVRDQLENPELKAEYERITAIMEEKGADGRTPYDIYKFYQAEYNKAHEDYLRASQSAPNPPMERSRLSSVEKNLSGRHTLKQKRKWMTGTYMGKGH